MASPHVAGTVALMWSSSPVIVGDIAATTALLDSTAVDVPNLTCGGTDDDNNVWGEGRLDAFAAVEQSPAAAPGCSRERSPRGVTGSPIAGARVEAVGPVARTTTTSPSGGFTLTLPVGTYEVTVRLFGFVTAVASGVEIERGRHDRPGLRAPTGARARCLRTCP